jgi:uncharacterized membrane protein
MFESGQIVSGLGSTVLRTDFQGLVNDETNDTVIDNDDDGVTDDETSRTDKSSSSLSGGQVAGTVIGTLIGLALIAIVVVFFIHRRRNQHYPNNNNNNNNKSRTMDVTQEDFHDLGIGSADLYNEEYDDRDDRVMIDRSVIASDDGSFHSNYADKVKTAVYIIEDDQETLYTRDFPQPTEPSFSERIRSAERPGPTFVKTNEVLYQMNQQHNDETDEMEYALERSVADGSAVHRDYNAPDTVQL